MTFPFRFRRPRRPALSEPLQLDVAGKALSVTIRRNARTRRLTLRLDRDGGGLTVTAPPGFALSRIARFVEGQRPWVAERRARLAAAVPFAPGAVLPIRGTPVEIRHRPGRPAAPRLEGDALVVGGEPEHLARRVRDFLVGQARAELSRRALAFADALGVRPAGITVRDATSRWGSCSSARRLAFSWRLILAPDPVIDYVAAHEVAHLVEMNHGPGFWALVERLVGDSGPARAWLRDHGAALHRYGAAPDA